jgi:5-methylcytosine-specific restriction enzyme subunit McrC
MKTIELFEWERGSQKSTFSESELRNLKIFNDSIQRSEKADAITITYGKIFTYSYVGIIQIGKKRIEILPKLYNPDRNVAINALDPSEQEKLKRTARKNLFSLLSFSGLIPFYKSGISRYGKEQDFFEFLIALFLTDLEMIMSSHFHHEYIHESDDIGHIKGKLDYQQQIVKLPSQLHTFSCIYDEFSIDNPLNRIIKATLKKIQELCKNEENKKRAFNYYSLMHEIEDEIIVPSYLSKLHFNRLNKKYEGIVEFCCMILFGSTYSADEGEHHYYALIFDMNLVFEKYVTKLLRNSLHEYTFDYQNDLYLSSEYRLIFQYVRDKKRMIPDIIVRDHEKSIAVIDTKYKPDLSNGFISNSDTYQMLAYSVANESDKAILLYPKLPIQDQLNECEHFVVLDKLVSERKKDRSVLISARSVQLFDESGKILRKFTQDDTEIIKGLLSSQILPKEVTLT